MSDVSRIAAEVILVAGSSAALVNLAFPSSNPDKKRDDQDDD